jgi:hypothetical protein
LISYFTFYLETQILNFIMITSILLFIFKTHFLLKHLNLFATPNAMNPTHNTRQLEQPPVYNLMSNQGKIIQ